MLFRPIHCPLLASFKFLYFYTGNNFKHNFKARSAESVDSRTCLASEFNTVK